MPKKKIAAKKKAVAKKGPSGPVVTIKAIPEKLPFLSPDEQKAVGNLTGTQLAAVNKIIEQLLWHRRNA